MTAIVAMATVLISLGTFLDFLLGPPGHRRIKDQLINFYISIEEGDWSLLYRSPATALLRFIVTIFGDRLFHIRFFLTTIALSTIMTTLMLLSYIFIVYIQAVWHQTNICPAPPISLALQVPFFIMPLLPVAFAANVIFDVITWSLTVCGLRLIRVTKRVNVIIFLFLAMLIIFFFVLHFLHALFLTVSLLIDNIYYVNNYSNSFYNKQFIRFFLDPLLDKDSFTGFIRVKCFVPPAHPFDVSFLGLAQYLALEALLPAVLFILTCLLGSILYLTRRITHKSTSLIVERLASSNNVCVTIASLLSAVIAVVKILTGSAR